MMSALTQTMFQNPRELYQRMLPSQSLLKHTVAQIVPVHTHRNRGAMKKEKVSEQGSEKSWETRRVLNQYEGVTREGAEEE
mmetsp:Transcript_21437/g.21555  ORF Transcript_21437/g.21555 Transcript_21437/m.21555 type:complete len:81 (-) Transcript_21437:466-708(-)